MIDYTSAELVVLAQRREQARQDVVEAQIRARQAREALTTAEKRCQMVHAAYEIEMQIIKATTQ